ncbi:MAG TPA: methyltransferase [Rhodospirillaceae bacterium]|nr:methyltransferase [Rhodospirillaceae bacterium]
MTDSAADGRDRRVQSQYESYPYPARDPADEKERLITGSPSNLHELNHYVFGGTRDLTKPLRVLAAGGGTGDAAIMLAQQMNDNGIPGEVVHLDLSEPSQAIAKARADARGLENMHFVKGSLLDVAKVAPGPWDYIDCCGVLHHLEDPETGLRKLAGQLADDGGIGVMVYGEYGRTGVYHMQNMLQKIAPGDELEDDERIDLARRLTNSLPATAWLLRNGLIQDHVSGGDAGLYDLFLHSRDRAFLVPDVDNFIKQAGLRLAGFIEPFRYDPDWFLRDPRLAKRLRNLDPMARAAFAELLTGNLHKHIFYAVQAGNPVSVPGTDDPGTVPHLVNLHPLDLAGSLPTGGKINITADGLKIEMTVPALSRAIAALCDGTRSLADIHAAIREKRSDLDYGSFMRQFEQFYQVMNAINRVVLRRPV